MTVQTVQFRLDFRPAVVLAVVAAIAAVGVLVWRAQTEIAPEPEKVAAKPEPPKVARTLKIAQITPPKPAPITPPTPTEQPSAPKPLRSPAAPRTTPATPPPAEVLPEPQELAAATPTPPVSKPEPVALPEPSPPKVRARAEEKPAKPVPKRAKAPAREKAKPASRPDPPARAARAPKERAQPQSPADAVPAKAKAKAKASRSRRTDSKVAAAFSLRLPSNPGQLRAFAQAHGARFAVARTTGRKAQLVKWLGWRGNHLVPVGAGGGGGLIRKLRDRRQLRALGDPAARVSQETGLPRGELFVEVFLDSGRVRAAMSAALRRAGIDGDSLDAQLDAARGAHVICRGTPTGAIECGVTR